MFDFKKKINTNQIIIKNSLFIGDNAILTIDQTIDKFVLEVKSTVIEIPFLVSDNRYNLDFSSIFEIINNQGKHKMFAMVGNNKKILVYNDTSKTSTKNAYSSSLTSITGYKMAFFYNKNNELRVAKFSEENWQVVEAENLENEQIVKTDFINFNKNNYLHLSVDSKLLVHLQRVQFTSVEKFVDLNFWINENNLIIDMNNLDNELKKCESNTFYKLEGIFSNENSKSTKLFLLTNQKQTLYQKSITTRAGLLKGRLYIDNVIFFKAEYSKHKDWEIQGDIVINNGNVSIPLSANALNLIDYVIIRIQKTKYEKIIQFRKTDTSIIINERELKELDYGYVLECVIIDTDDGEHKLIDETKKEVANVYKHHVLDSSKNLKTYAYYTFNGRLNFYKSFLPVEIFKAESIISIDAKLQKNRIKFVSNDEYEAIIQTDYKKINKIDISKDGSLQLIDLSTLKVEHSQTIQLLLKKKGNFDYERVRSINPLIDDLSDFDFESSTLRFIPKSELKLSIIVTFYNTEKYLDKLFSSLYKQGLTNNEFEVVAVNDSSTDNSSHVAELYARKYSNFRIVTHEFNKGLGEARNTGIDVSHGEYIAFVDGDDFIADGAYKKMLSIIDRTGSQVITGGVKRWRNNKQEISWLYRKVFIKNVEKTTLSDNPELVYDMTAWNKLYRRDWFVSCGFRYPTMLYEDVPVTMPVFERADSIDIFSETMYYWFIRDINGDKSITNNRTDIKNFSDRMVAIRSAVEVLKTNIRALQEYEYKVLHMDLAIYLRHFLNVDENYKNILSTEISWALNEFSPISLKSIPNRELKRLQCAARGDWEKLRTFYEEEELA